MSGKESTGYIPYVDQQDDFQPSPKPESNKICHNAVIDPVPAPIDSPQTAPLIPNAKPVTNQPERGVVNVQPNTYYVISLLNYVFCCFLLGSYALEHSKNAGIYYAAGRFEEYEAETKKAKYCNIAGCIIGPIISISAILTVTIILVVTLN